jgi:hypothetical protein
MAYHITHSASAGLISIAVLEPLSSSIPVRRCSCVGGTPWKIVHVLKRSRFHFLPPEVLKGPLPSFSLTRRTVCRNVLVVWSSFPDSRALSLPNPHPTLLSATAFDPPGLGSLTTTPVVLGKIESAARRANPTAHGIAGLARPRAFRQRSGVRDREQQIANAVSVK